LFFVFYLFFIVGFVLAVFSHQTKSALVQ